MTWIIDYGVLIPYILQQRNNFEKVYVIKHGNRMQATRLPRTLNSESPSVSLRKKQILYTSEVKQGSPGSDINMYVQLGRQ